jgi:epoxyqueuosine reductase
VINLENKAPLMPMDAASLTAALKDKARQLGFDLAGAAPAAPVPDVEYLENWLGEGMAGEMSFFQERIGAYRDPNLVLPGVKSIMMLGVNYRTAEPISPGPGQAAVSRYAWGADYHLIIREKLRELADYLRHLAPQCGVRGVVDTAPLLERAYASRAGLGWIGKNTCLINKQFGSWIFLAALLTTEMLKYDEPGGGLPDQDLCGECRACIDACPTGALEAPYRLNARKCISYLTVESRGPIPEGLRGACGKRLFGCDACQEACPRNRGTPESGESGFQPRPGTNPIDLAELLALDEAGFRHRFRDTPIWRIKLSGLLRNAAG